MQEKVLSKQEILDFVCEYSDKNYNIEDYYNWYYTRIGPNEYQVEFESDYAWRIGYNWINSYQNVKHIKDVLNDNYFNYMLSNEHIQKDIVISISDFVTHLLNKYIWQVYMDMSIENAVLFEKEEKGIYLACVTLDEDLSPNQGVIHIGLVDDPYLNIITFKDLEIDLINNLTCTLQKSQDTLENLVNTLIEQYSRIE